MPEEGPLLVGRSSDGRWRCSAHLSLTEQNEFVIYRLDVRPWGSELIPLGTDVLRRLPLGRWLTSAHSWLTAPLAEWLDSGSPSPSRPVDEKEWRRLRQEAERIVKSELPKRGPKGYGSSFYRRIALSYLELQAHGVARGIQGRIAEQENTRRGNKGMPVTATNVRDWLSRATELGFLSPGTKGRAGRAPGPNLYDTTEED